MKKFIAKINEIYKPFRKAALMMFVFIGVSQALMLVSPYLYGKIVDAVIEGRSMRHILIFAGLSFLAYMLQGTVLNYYREKFELHNLDFDVFRRVTKTTMEKTLSLSIGQHANENSGIKKSIIDKGEHSLTTLAYTALYEILPIVAQVVFAVVALFYLSAILGIIVLFAVSLFVGVTVYINTKLGGELKEFQNISNKNSKMHSEILRNINVVQVSAQEERMVNEYDKRIVAYSDFGKKMWMKYVFFSSLRSIITSMARFGVIAVGAYYVYKGIYSPGYLVVFLAWSSNAFNRLDAVGPLHRRCMELYSAVKKYFIFTDIEPAVQTVKNPIRPTRLEGRIEFKNVSFQYPTQRYLTDDEEREVGEIKRSSRSLTNISLTIEPGQKVAFVGHSGAGKSTIARMLVRAYDPDAGQITVDGNDLRLIDLKQFRENVGVVEQDVALFDETLRYNICYGLNGKGEHITEQELDSVAQEACIDKFHHRLEKGYETVIGERGVKLSGGECQRVGIARALIKKPQILIFDEATSHLDAENERLIRKAIEKASHGRTTIIIAHRLSTIKNVDKIFVMEKGALVGQGTHKELMESCEAYERLISSQIASV